MKPERGLHWEKEEAAEQRRGRSRLVMALLHNFSKEQKGKSEGKCVPGCVPELLLTFELKSCETRFEEKGNQDSFLGGPFSFSFFGIIKGQGRAPPSPRPGTCTYLHSDTSTGEGM